MGAVQHSLPGLERSPAPAAGSVSPTSSPESISMALNAIQALVALVGNPVTNAVEEGRFPPEVLASLGEATKILRRDINLASVLQQGLLPRIPSSRFWQMSYFFRPLADVSGDILDFYTFGDVVFGDEDADEQLGFLLLDASGHGISSALVTAIARPLFFAHHRANKSRPLHRAIDDANVELCREIGNLTSYLTGISVRLTRDTLTYCNASHPLALLYRAKTGKVASLPNDAFLLGIPDFITRGLTSRTAPVERGDILLIFTDGLVDSPNSAGKALDEKVLAGMLRKYASATASEIQSAILRLVQTRTDDFATVEDDITFVVARKVA